MPDFLVYMVTTAFLYSAPLIVLVWFLRKRIDRTFASALVALAFMAATSFSLWRMEWYDVWRHGVPPIAFIVTSYGPALSV